MSRKKSRKHEPFKPRPRPGTPGIIKVDKRMAARAQLESAIWLWFHDADSISIHALASAAHDLLHVMSSQAGKPDSSWETALRKMPEGFQVCARYFQNFIKHGFKDLKGDVEYHPFHGTTLIFAAVECYRGLFPPTALMNLFLLRFNVENPDFTLPHARWKIEQLGRYADAQIKRKQFLDDLLPIMQRQLG